MHSFHLLHSEKNNMFSINQKRIFAKIFFLIAVIDPLGSVPVYLEATKQLDQKDKKKVAVRASFVAFLILLFFIVVGN